MICIWPLDNHHHPWQSHRESNILNHFQYSHLRRDLITTSERAPELLAEKAECTTSMNGMKTDSL